MHSLLYRFSSVFSRSIAKNKMGPKKKNVMKALKDQAAARPPRLLLPLRKRPSSLRQLMRKLRKRMKKLRKFGSSPQPVYTAPPLPVEHSPTQ